MVNSKPAEVFDFCWSLTKLKSKFLSETLIEKIIKKISDEINDDDTCKKLIKKKSYKYPGYKNDFEIKNKFINFLMNKGFSYDCIKKHLWIKTFQY